MHDTVYVIAEFDDVEAEFRRATTQRATISTQLPHYHETKPSTTRQII